MTREQSKDKLLYQEVEHGCIQGVKSLHQEGAGLEWIDREGRTPLILACMNQTLYNVAKLLIELGADVNAYNRGCCTGTPLHHAVEKCLNLTVMLLLSHGANPSVTNKFDKSPLDIARTKGYSTIIRTIEEFLGSSSIMKHPSNVSHHSTLLRANTQTFLAIAPYQEPDRKLKTSIQYANNVLTNTHSVAVSTSGSSGWMDSSGIISQSPQCPYSNFSFPSQLSGIRWLDEAFESVRLSLLGVESIIPSKQKVSTGSSGLSFVSSTSSWEDSSGPMIHRVGCPSPIKLSVIERIDEAAEDWLGSCLSEAKSTLSNNYRTTVDHSKIQPASCKSDWIDSLSGCGIWLPLVETSPPSRMSGIGGLGDPSGFDYTREGWKRQSESMTLNNDISIHTSSRAEHSESSGSSTTNLQGLSGESLPPSKLRSSGLDEESKRFWLAEASDESDSVTHLWQEEEEIGFLECNYNPTDISGTTTIPLAPLDPDDGIDDSMYYLSIDSSCSSEVSSSEWLESHASEDFQNYWNVSELEITNLQRYNTLTEIPGAPYEPSAPPIQEGVVDLECPILNMIDPNQNRGASISASHENKRDPSSSSCVICLDAPIEGVCIPCGHMAGCMTCLNLITTKKWGCPVCRAKLDQVIRFYTV